MGLVVSDSSTLIHLASIQRLSLLKQFYGRISIPPAVWDEVVKFGNDRAGAIEVSKAYQEKWIVKAKPRNTSLIRLLIRDLDRGESEAIALAIEKQADLILIDESDGRRVAALYGLVKTGVVGILIRAKRQGLIASLQQELDRLRTQGNFYIDEALYLRALSAAGE